MPDNAFIKSKNGDHRKQEPTKKWEILFQWKGSSTTWENLKDMKDCYPLEMANYDMEKDIDKTSAFSWWATHAIRKKDIIISKLKSKYCVRK